MKKYISEAKSLILSDQITPFYNYHLPLNCTKCWIFCCERTRHNLWHFQPNLDIYVQNSIFGRPITSWHWKNMIKYEHHIVRLTASILRYIMWLGRNSIFQLQQQHCWSFWDFCLQGLLDTYQIHIFSYLKYFIVWNGGSY